MEILDKLNGEIYDVTLSGKFTFTDHLEFRRVLETLESGEAKRVLIDMASVDFVDSAALGMLLLLRDIAQRKQQEVLIRGATGHVQKIFEMAKFETMFTMV